MIQAVLNGMITMLMARFIMNDLPHAAGMLSNGEQGRSLKTAAPQGLPRTTTIYLPLETQEVMSNLLRREKGRTRMVEYGFGLVLRGKNLLPGVMKRGYRGQIGIEITDPALGFFHTHPMNTFSPMFSETDTIEVFLLPNRRLSGVGHPDYSTTEVCFITLTKAPPPGIIFDILDNLPGIYAEGVHMYELEEYYTIYEFTLGIQPLPMEVLLEWIPPRLPPRWWKPKETLEEFLQRKLPE